MTKLTKDDYLKKMEETNILLSRNYTFPEYTDELLKFQEMILKLVMKNDYTDDMRIDEAIARLESMARKNDVSTNPDVRKGIAALRTVSKEISISMAGRTGENLVSRTLGYIGRADAKVYKNVYVSNHQDETELDHVIVTRTGIVILEIKKSKDNLVITKEGRLMHSSGETFEKDPLGKKMERKRNLLKEKIELELAKKGINIPVIVDSYIVFTTPKGVRIKVNDLYKREKWCYRTSIVRTIDEYVGYSNYSEENLKDLNTVLEIIEPQRKRFDINQDYDQIRCDIADALTIIDGSNIIDWKRIVSRKNMISAAAFIGSVVLPIAAGPIGNATAKAFPKVAPFVPKMIKVVQGLTKAVA